MLLYIVNLGIYLHSSFYHWYCPFSVSLPLLFKYSIIIMEKWEVNCNFKKRSCFIVYCLKSHKEVRNVTNIYFSKLILALLLQCKLKGVISVAYYERWRKRVWLPWFTLITTSHSSNGYEHFSERHNSLNLTPEETKYLDRHKTGNENEFEITEITHKEKLRPRCLQ